MEEDQSTIIAKRRRTSKNCVGCRKSKVKCDRKIPCTRCSKLKTPCQYFEVPKDPNTEKLEELENEISQLKALLSSRPAIDQQATPANSMSSSIPQTSPFDQLIGQSTSPVQNDAALENADLLSAHLSGGSTITRSSWQELPRDFTLPQGLPGEPNAAGRAYFAWAGHQQMAEREAQSEWIDDHSTFTIRKTPLPDTVAGGLASHRDAEQWFQCFFEGSDRLVPVFSPADTFQSVRERSSLLFDVILTIGCKIYIGSGSPQYQSMHRHLRQRISNHVLSSLVVSSVETVQALLVLSCYWEKSWLFMDLALWMTQELKLPDAVEQMMARMAGEGTGYLPSTSDPSREEHALFQMARVCCGVYVLDKMQAPSPLPPSPTPHKPLTPPTSFSLDGGKTPGITSSPNPRRLRCLLSHPSRTAIDLRLLSQVELNAIRARIHASLTSFSPATPEHRISSALRNARLDLALWHADWTASPATALDRANLSIQHHWALIAAHLHALRVLAVQNIAVVTDAQRAIVLAARAAADAHLRHLLDGGDDNNNSSNNADSSSPYLSAFRWATRFVWAKLAFSVLLALRLALLLGDSAAALGQLGDSAGKVVDELRRAVEGEEEGAEYFAILETGVAKFRGAAGARAGQQEQQQGARRGDDDNDEADFRTYLPRQFSFDWDFPGLNLQYVPLDWEELFGGFEEML